MTEPMQPLEPETETEPEGEPVEAPTPADDEQTEAEEADEGAHEGEPVEAQPPEGEPPPEEEAPQGASQAEWEAFFTKASKSWSTYERRIYDLYPGDAHELFPVIVSPGAPPGFANVNDAGRVPDELKQPIMEFFGLARPVELAQDPHTRTCPVCEGEGELLTGSHVAKNRKHRCDECKGYGFVPPPSRPENGRTTADVQLAPIGEHAEPVNDEDRDSWQEPRLLPDGRENPNFGKMPQHKVPISPWGITAGLTVQDELVAAPNE